MKIRIVGKQWNFAFYGKEHMGRDLGGCDPPSKKGKEIYILDSLRGRLALDTVLHECLHASSWAQFDETFVDTLATDLARVVFHPDVLRRVLDDPAVKEILNERSGANREATQEAAVRETRPDAVAGQAAPGAEAEVASS